MIEKLTMLLCRFPAIVRELGAVLYKVGGFGLIAGACAQVGKLAASTALGMAGQLPVNEIAQLLTGVWTWWIPKSFSGFAFCVVTAGIGAALTVVARDAQRQLWLQ